ncbi:MAG: DinB family protein [Candidatus Acidiferrales bacterium]
METPDREQLLRLLKASRKKLVESVEDLTDEQAKMRPAEDRWSILECVEHVGQVEDAIFDAVTTKLPRSEAPADRSREQKVISGATDRNRKVAAPEHVKPAGKFSSLADALAHFEKSRARSIEYVENCEQDLRTLTGPHPVLGQASGQEFMIIMALHPARHALQILETREALGLD